MEGEPLPRGVPLLIVANHVNSMVDPVLLLGFLGVSPRFLAKHTLWSHPVIGPLLMISGAVPVYRRQDTTDVSKNVDTFARCRRTLAAGGVVALFPEGTSHNQPRSLPLKTGAARIALAAEAEYGPLGLRIVPVGLTYEAKDRFRSRVLVRVGAAIDPAPQLSQQGTAPGTAVRELTGRIAAALDELTLGHTSWDEARLTDLAAALLARDGYERPLSEILSLRKAVIRGYRALEAEDPARAAGIVYAVARYDGYLQALTLTDEDVRQAGHGAARRRAARAAQRWAMVPAAAVGTALNWIPYRLVGWVANRFTRTPDEPATYKVLTALIAFPVTWLLEVAAAAVLGGWRWAVFTLVLAPVTGWVALAFHEARGWFFPVDRAYRRRRPVTPGALRALVAEREALQGELLALAAGRATMPLP
ncbi:MAG TPA: 1-acyl-sn-glycerol-3-phosphate acyltransferase [Vicinamibacteria bacterium]|nr:1-acyl-sn-glycerol-3-phosphate acyltransferase [Vicinamibacteria bacterium]